MPETPSASDTQQNLPSTSPTQLAEPKRGPTRAVLAALVVPGAPSFFRRQVLSWFLIVFGALFPVAMLVVCANWGIGDGTLREPPPPARTAAFVDGLRRAAVLAGWQERGRYEPIPAVDLILAGDTCDWYASRHWLEGGRPWRRDAASRRSLERVVAGALLEARRTLLPLTALLRGGLTLPGADRRGR